MASANDCWARISYGHVCGCAAASEGIGGNDSCSRVAAIGAVSIAYR